MKKTYNLRKCNNQCYWAEVDKTGSNIHSMLHVEPKVYENGQHTTWKRELTTKELQSKVVGQHIHPLGNVHTHVRTFKQTELFLVSFPRWCRAAQRLNQPQALSSFPRVLL